MTPSLSLRAVLATGLLALLTAGSAGPVALDAASAQAPVDRSAAGCGTAPSHARVRVGGSSAADPNSVTVAETQAMERRLQAGIAQLQARVAARTAHGVRLPSAIRVNVYFHVITRSDGTGDVADSQLRKQVDVLNQGYGGRSARRAAVTPFSFALKGIDRTRNDDWYDWTAPNDDGTDTDFDDVEAKTALHKGGLRDLNVYVAGLGDNLLGYAYFPGTISPVRDGVVILNDSLPGGAASPYNEGDTLTHEAGHWLGLFHTFENGCAYPGDEVVDTPYQLDGDNIFGCVESDDTCSQPGRDPVHNFMSYGDDPCLDAFTYGQALRMTWSWLVYRARG